MEGDGVTATATASTAAIPIPIPIPSPPPNDLDFSPAGSPEIGDSHLEAEDDEEVPRPSDDHQPSRTPILTDDLRDKIIKQVEYYFSDENLATDKFMMKYISKSKDGYVPVAIIASFRKMKKLTQERSLIVAALKESSLLVVSQNGKRVKRLHPLPDPESKDPKLCTVSVENLPEDHSTENIQRIFGAAGNVKNICIRGPHAGEEPTKRTIAEKLLSGKLHALVEYESVEAAEKAVATLNDEQDWRYGMRVKLLKKVVIGKMEPKKKAWRGTDSEKHSNSQASESAGDEENHYSSEHHDDTHDEEDGDHASKDKNGFKGRNRRWRRGQKYQGSNGQGHGTMSSSYGSEPLRPPPGPRMPDGTRGFTMGPPGPRMPDGTRGFTMGRGRPPTSNENS